MSEDTESTKPTRSVFCLPAYWGASNGSGLLPADYRKKIDVEAEATKQLYRLWAAEVAGDGQWEWDEK